MDTRGIRRAARELRAAKRDLRRIKQCPATAPVFTPSGEPVRCDLLAGHDGHHRHRHPGQLDAFTWR